MRRRAWGRLPAALGSVACMLVTLTACSPLDMLAFLGGCKNTGGSSTVQASQASGEWTGLVGRHQDQIKQMWPGQVSFCAPYDYGFQCTWWACMRQKSLGHDIGQYWGNGGEWDTSARNAGWEQGAQAGGIIVFNSGAGGSSSVYGHVAVVEQVNGDTVHTSEGGTGWGKVASARSARPILLPAFPTGIPKAEEAPARNRSCRRIPHPTPVRLLDWLQCVRQSDGG